MSALPATIPEDQPEDREIISNISLLSTLIEQHAENYYDRSSSAAIRRQIAQMIIQKVIFGQTRYLDASSEISSTLQPSAYGTEAARRSNHMNELCKLGASIKGHIGDHTANWNCGTFSRDEVVFPSLLRDGVEVRLQEVVGAGA